MSDEHDWIFDFVLQFLGSDRFDASVMDFVDENCHIFENTEENKFIYTDIYQEFLDHMEGVINSNLAELDVTPDVFYEACQKSRNSRDINQRVFEKLLAMEDFTVFKKIMVKRNTELQFEAMQAYKEYAGLSASLGQAQDQDELAQLPNPEELEQMLEDKEDELADEEFDPEKVESIYRESLLELELIHKQEELEQLELEQALAMSLMAEEERLKQARLEVKNAPDDDEEEEAEALQQHQSEAKQSNGGSDSAKSSAGNKDGDRKPTKAKLRPTEVPGSEHSYADPKPLKMSMSGLGSPLKALPSISKAKKQENLTEMNRSFNEKKKRTEQAFSKNSQQLNDSRSKQSELTKGVSVAEEEARKRSEYMQAQRDKLVAAKKRERELKVQAEDARLGRPPRTEEGGESKDGGGSAQKQQKAPLSRKEEEQEEQRAAMRMALARRMKQSLVESEEARLSEQYDSQYSALDSKLIEVERLRAENQMRENMLAENLRRQQAAIARNVQRSAAQLRQEDNRIR